MMKVLAINGSPKPNGNTAQSLQILLQTVQEEGIETELITIGNKKIHGCIGCAQCAEQQNGRCAAFDDTVNELLPKMIAADGLVLGSPVYFSGINGTMKSFLDRAFFVSYTNGGLLRLKIGASVVAVRRSGGTAAFDQLNKYLQISELMTVGSCYWNVIHGFSPGEIYQDFEGLRILRTLGRNLAWMLKLVEHGQGHVTPPTSEEIVTTNFVR
ncbi:MAG: flavodoxin family protein [Planctomycetaceae bacterium]|jgi:multimeric flavodoxin WrbA|nr:flavodoxin family protein [Planctomycetaceae bacterium]